ncbi:MFS transporter [Erysipelothrix urinaevulpis]|uniref:MFS transporter n=1 Tax=Erysipelothrix urinaevulpis TaxID=2683717 RepID=UPI00135BBE16|nr:MFS transporter [Erysipelothrix urinaevulpis]
MKNSLWSKNFKLLVAGTFLSALGGIGLNLAFGLVIFDQTQSTFLSGVFTTLAMIPYLVFPLLIGPYIDRHDPLKVLLHNEKILLVIYFLAGIIVKVTDFNFLLYLGIILLISIFSIVSEIASQSITPQLIAKENFSKGFAIMSTIYPLAQVIVSPLALFIYGKFGLSMMFFIYTFFSFIDIIIESKIKFDFVYDEDRSVSNIGFLEDIQSGFKYLKTDSSLIAVLLFFSLVMFTSASNTLWYPYFATSKTLNLNQYGFMMATSSAGYLFGGLLHYVYTIKDKDRYKIAVVVYFTFVILDSLFFFVPFVGMCFIRFVLGILGMNSANIRTTAVQQRLNPIHRAKVNTIYSVMFNVSMMIGQVVIGFLGDYFEYSMVMVLVQGVYLLAIILFILPQKYGVSKLYNYSTNS